MLQPGDRLPDLPLVTADGVETSLRDLAAGEATAIIFLRHLG